jgi:hypothetical protein
LQITFYLTIIEENRKGRNLNESVNLNSKCLIAPKDALWMSAVTQGWDVKFSKNFTQYYANGVFPIFQSFLTLFLFQLSNLLYKRLSSTLPRKLNHWISVIFKILKAEYGSVQSGLYLGFIL